MPYACIKGTLNALLWRAQPLPKKNTFLHMSGRTRLYFRWDPLAGGPKIQKGQKISSKPT